MTRLIYTDKRATITQLYTLYNCGEQKTSPDAESKGYNTRGLPGSTLEVTVSTGLPKQPEQTTFFQFIESLCALFMQLLPPDWLTKLITALMFNSTGVPNKVDGISITVHILFMP